VRFRDGQALYHLVLAAVRDRLRRANLVPRLQVPKDDGTTAVDEPAAPARAADDSIPGPQPAQHDDVIPSSGRPVVPSLPISSSQPAIQLHDAYLVVETPDGMLVIDQHALHERILFEQLRRRVQSGQLERQRLLIPEPVELSPAQAAAVLEHRADLAELGLEVSDFGGSTVLLGSYPAVLGKRPPQAILRAVVDYLVARERPPAREVLLNDLLSLMACHGAVRAGDRLTPEEIAALAAQRHLAQDTHHCPHGRPTSLFFSRHDLDRQFRRI
jgi:DNA mismatch repair protein MutL